jgi:hypothetical protein
VTAPASLLSTLAAIWLLSSVAAAPALAHNSAAPPDGVRTTAAGPATVCRPGGDTVVIDGTVAADEEGSYRLLPFRVLPRTTRVELHYDYGDVEPADDAVPNSDTVVDIGLWDQDGTEGPEAFRGWGGSHHGVMSKGRPPIWVQADSAHRGFGGGPVEPGVWHVELGFGNVSPSGGTYHVEITCLAPDVGPPPASDPVDPSHVARAEPGWYHGDFHMHAYDSSPDGPTNGEVVAHAKAVGLDFLPITEYVTSWHHQTWGAAARANPDIIVWPSREVITYDGHGIVLGETPNVVDYRVGHRGITMRELQERSLADGARFGIAHPTIFPEPALGDFCRGCEAQYLDVVDLDGVLTLEVLTGPVEYDASYLGGPPVGPGIEMPFMQTAIDLWERLLLDGHRITAVSGSDAKDAAGHGTNATAVYAEELSRPALIAALAQGRAYVRTRGVDDSPELELTATADGDTVMMGGTLLAAEAELAVTVRGGAGQVIEVIRNGEVVATLPITGDDVTTTVPALRGDDGGPLGTFYRVDVREPGGIRSIVSNPIFLAAAAPVAPAPQPGPGTDGGVHGGAPVDAVAPGPDPRLAATGGGLGLIGLAALLVAIVAHRAAGHRLVRARSSSATSTGFSLGFGKNDV